MQITSPSEGPERPSKARSAAARAFTIIADVMILAVHVVVFAAIVMWLFASGLHLNLLGRIVIGVPILIATLYACFQILRMAQAAERRQREQDR